MKLIIPITSLRTRWFLTLLFLLNLLLLCLFSLEMWLFTTVFHMIISFSELIIIIFLSFFKLWRSLLILLGSMLEFFLLLFLFFKFFLNFLFKLLNFIFILNILHCLFISLRISKEFWTFRFLFNLFRSLLLCWSI